jgi:hypothetical protein
LKGAENENGNSYKIRFGGSVLFGLPKYVLGQPARFVL